MQGGKTKTILALRPGKREMGIAVVESPAALSGASVPACNAGSSGKRVEPELMFWGVSGFRASGKALLEAVEQRVMDLMQRYQPDVVAIEEPTAARLKASPALSGIVDRIQAVAEDADLGFMVVPPADVGKKLCGSAQATRRDLVANLVERYSHLGRYQVHARPGEREYWLPMFVAVGVGVSIAVRHYRN